MSRVIPLLIATAVLLLIDVYAFQAIRSAMYHSGVVSRRIVFSIYWTITAILIAFAWYLAFCDYYQLPKVLRVYLISSFFVFYIPKLLLIPFLLIDDIGRMIRWTVARFSSSGVSATRGISRSQFLVQAGLLVSGFIFFQFIYGIIRTANTYQIRKVRLPFSNLPDEFDGLKIVQISDFHSGSYTRMEPVHEMIKLVNAQQPDIIFFTGDLVNNRSDEALEYMDALKQLKARKGSYSIFGNHDFGDYYQWPSKEAKAANLKHLEEIESQLGWTLLRNKHVLLGEPGNQLAIIGVDNWSNIGHFAKYGDLKKAYEGTAQAKVKLLLSHDPSHWMAEVVKSFPDIDVMFAGHTHGFQFGFEIPGLRWSPAKYIYPQWAGLYSRGRQQLYVNRGLGFLGYNGRVGIAPEITVFELAKA